MAGRNHIAYRDRQADDSTNHCTDTAANRASRSSKRTTNCASQSATDYDAAHGAATYADYFIRR